MNFRNKPSRLHFFLPKSKCLIYKWKTFSQVSQMFIFENSSALVLMFRLLQGFAAPPIKPAVVVATGAQSAEKLLKRQKDKQNWEADNHQMSRPH